MRAWLGALVVGSIGVGLVLIVACRWRHQRGVTLAKLTSSALALLSLPLLLQVGDGKSISLAWIPGIEAASLTLGATGLYLSVTAFFALALTLVWNCERPPPAGGSHYWPGVAHIMCGLVVAALTLDQFLVRYVVLELIALCTLLTFFVEIASARVSLPLWHRYMQFRIGDAGLMLAILLLDRSRGTFNIEGMLANPHLLPLGSRVSIVLGGLIAAFVKMGLPPFHGWLLDSANLSWEKHIWLSFALPVLGVYLLYRFAPLLMALDGLRVLLVIAGVCLMLWAFIKTRASGQPFERAPWLLIAHGAVALVLAGTPGIRMYLLTFIPVRVALCVLTARKWERFAPVLAPPQGNVVTLQPDGWLLAVAGWDERFERRGLERVNQSVANTLLWLARASASSMEREILERMNRRMVSSILWLARTSASSMERKILDGTISWLTRLALGTGRALQSGHTGRLRRNLLWVSFGLIGLISLALLTLPN